MRRYSVQITFEIFIIGKCLFPKDFSFSFCRSLKGKETISKEVMANNESHIVTDKFTSLTAEKLNKKTPQSQNSKSKKDYNTDHLYRPIKPKPHSGL